MTSPRRNSGHSAQRVQEWAEDAAVASLEIEDQQSAGPASTTGTPTKTLPLRSVSARADAIRGTSVTISIPLDEASPPKAVRPTEPVLGADGKPGATPRRKVLRRDSLERREALLKGKEGSRRRQRWENDRLLSNPWAVPPLPSDWEVQPTYPRTVVPYFLAPLWEADASTRARRMSKQQKAKAQSTASSRSTVLPRELREKLKRAKSAKGLLMDLETEVRSFVEQWNKRLVQLEEQDLDNVIEEDSDEEEVVFVGRNGQMRDVPPSPQAKERKSRANDTKSRANDTNGRPSTADSLAYSSDSDILELESPGEALGVLATEKLVFGGLADDQGASFARWIVHSIGDYYGLRTWSVTVGNPARREAYVGIDSLRSGRKGGELTRELPRPLWGLV